MIATIYDAATGVIRAVINSPYPSVIGLNVREGEAVIEGEYDAARVYIRDDTPREYPPRPGEWAVWTGSEWTDPRTADDHEAERQARRHSSFLTKSEFLQACMSVGLLTPAEAAAAARGDVPESYGPALATMSAEQRDRVAVIWPAVTRIERMDPLILAVAAGAGISDETLDAMFGLAPYSP